MQTTTAIPTYGGWLELSRRALRHNLAGVAKLAQPAEVMAVVKANAYGAGAVGVARELQEAGVTRFAVATVDEAVRLREAGIRGDIVCLTYFDRGDAEAIRGHDLTVTVFSRAGASLLDSMARETDESRRVWVKVDTGLARLGVPSDTAAAFIEGLLGCPGLRIAGIYSTLTENRACDNRQLASLLALRARLPGLRDAVWSLASSHAIVTLPESRLDVVRAGILLLGFPPSEPRRLDAARMSAASPMSIVTWKSRVADVKDVFAGNQVGYGEQPPLARDTRVASLMTGWADGYHGTPQAGSRVVIRGRRCAVLGLSANTTLVDVTGVESAQAGDEAVLLGTQDDAEVTVDELAATGGGVYRMLAGIPAGAPRIWSS